MATKVESELLIPNICCTYHLLIGRLYSIVKTECKNDQKDAANLLKSITDSTVKDIINFGL